MVARWIEHSSARQQVAASSETENFSHREAIVSWYDSERGYGFAEAGLGKSIFVHRTTLEQAGIDLIEKGRQDSLRHSARTQGKVRGHCHPFRAKAGRRAHAA